MHVELVGIDLALHHHLAEPPCRGDEHHVLEPRLGVDREGHSARAPVAAHHALDAGRERDLLVREALVRAVGDRTVVVERCEHLAHRGHHCRRAAHVEQRLLLSRERGFGEVFRGGGGAHRHRAVRVAGRQLRVARAQLVFERRRQGRRLDPAADISARGRERPYVGHVEIGEALANPAVEPVAGQELAERVRGGREPAGHPHAGCRQLADQLAERRVLAADAGHVGHSQGVERENPFHGRSHAVGASRAAPRVGCAEYPFRTAGPGRLTSGVRDGPGARTARCAVGVLAILRTRPTGYDSLPRKPERHPLHPGTQHMPCPAGGNSCGEPLQPTFEPLDHDHREQTPREDGGDSGLPSLKPPAQVGRRQALAGPASPDRCGESSPAGASSSRSAAGSRSRSASTPGGRC